MPTIKEIVVVSNFPDEFAAKEDVLLTEALKKYAPAKLVYLRDVSPDTLNGNSTYIFRCIYDNSIGSVTKDMAPIYARLHEKRIPYLTVHNGKGDQQGKKYLADLYSLGYPVVPTFTDTVQALTCPSDEYLVKPIYGGTGKGVQRIAKEALKDLSIDETFVIQPVLDVAFETSYLYIDDVFQFALKTRNDRWDLVAYEPTAAEIALGKRCTTWNPIKGIQRVDCLWTTDGTQYLLELEDWCPFLSLFDSENVPREQFVANLFASLQSFDYDNLNL